MSKNQTRLPNKIIWPKPIGYIENWAWYIERGFRELGIEIDKCNDFRETRQSRYEFAKGCYFFDLVYPEKTQRIWHDTSDLGKHYYDELVVSGEIYFKIHMKPEHKENKRMYPMFNRAPGPFYFEMQEGLREIRRQSNKDGFEYDIIAIFRATELQERVRSGRMIREQPWKSLSWMTNHLGREVPIQYRSKKNLSYEDYHEKAARSKIGLIMPGTANGDANNRLIEFSGAGTFCLMPEYIAPTAADMTDSFAFFKRDFSDFVDTVNYWLDNDYGRQQTECKQLEFYEQNLSPMGQANYILRTVDKVWEKG